MGRANQHPQPSREVVASLPRDRHCASAARRFLRDELESRAAEQPLERALLTTSELVTNAWKHGKGTIELRIQTWSDRVRIEVIDEGENAVPKIRERAGDDSGGWGLRIVDDLVLQWGCYEGTTHVWADIALSA